MVVEGGSNAAQQPELVSAFLFLFLFLRFFFVGFG